MGHGDWPRFLLLIACILGDPCAHGIEAQIVPEPLETFFVLLLQNVGLEPGAVISLNVSNLKPVNNTVLVIVTHSQWNCWLRQKLRPLPDGSYSSYLPSFFRRPFVDRVSLRHVIHAPGPDVYHVGVLNAGSDPIELEGFIDYSNPGGEHLPLQLVKRPLTLRVFAALFALLFLGSSWLLCCVWSRGSSYLHSLLLLCIGLKAVDLEQQAEYLGILSRQGYVNSWQQQGWHFIGKMQSIAEIAFLLLTALGWRVLRPSLSELEVRSAVFLFSMAFCIAALQATKFGSDESEAALLKICFNIVQVLCYMLIVFASTFNLQLINMHLVESPVSPTLAVLYRKQEAYLNFRHLVFAIVCRPSARLWLRLYIFQEQGTEWAADAACEVLTLVVYVLLLLNLRPGLTSRDPFLKLFRLASQGFPPTPTAAPATVYEAPAQPPDTPRSPNEPMEDDSLQTPYIPLPG